MKKVSFILILGLLLLTSVTQQTVSATTATGVDRDNETVTVGFYGRDSPDTNTNETKPGIGGNDYQNDANDHDGSKGSNSTTNVGNATDLINGHRIKTFFKNALLPQTGEQSGFWLSFIGSLILAILLLIFAKRRKQHDEAEA
ncbi:hypothetical protein FC84_GL000538 [Lapidilactobacillus dextrinicus DSM 20335]|uniref:Gram-positive cocci surface proteins LPxTG domain-containing protein n=1 Tax=Lapidilactobacillus dextrinicus DSM 20335 TaxID=1423738 RepID=A0A0R2BKE5_9LACO|nr:LPXTG cell wall anchor domain-containing protein [Lapidilactobacillus dextrinicus]KRM79841.1 hypothetical protein FC84_GL000538 [Lapidilactobacillus dextrinicus DSM 20335]